MSSGRTIPSLDGLRAVSIGLVLLGHVGATRHAPPIPETAVYYAEIGVRVFFVISGFLITHLLLEEQARTGRISLKNFYLRRAFRILPAAYCFLVVVTLAAWKQFSAANLFFMFTYLKCYYMKGPWMTLHLWSLSVEEQFYLLWPFAMAFAFRRRTAIAIATIAAVPLVRETYYVFRWPDAHFAFPAVADALAMGCLLALAQPYLDRWAGRIYRWWFFLVPLVALSIPLLPALLPASRLGTWLMRAYGLTSFSVMCLCIALCIDNAIRRQYRWLNTKPIMWAGVLSYSLYLWQMPFLDSHGTGWWTAFPQNLACAFACAVLSYYLVERPFLRLREKFRERPRKAAAIEVPVEAAV